MTPQTSWLRIPSGSHFSPANLPFGIISLNGIEAEKHVAVAIGEHVLDLHEFTRHRGFAKLLEIPATHLATFSQSTLNDFAALGQDVHVKIRTYLRSVFAEDPSLPEV